MKGQDMTAAKDMNRRTALKRIMATLEKLPSDEDRRAVVSAATSMHGEQLRLDEPTPGVTRGETHGGVPAVARRA
jgi:ABC-type branched-subunit amino acid transport system ATPase component